MDGNGQQASARPRVAVVGAGVAGLVAARELVRKGVEVTVFESADRVGGRTLAETTAAGSRVDLGGQWIGANHHHLIALADELGLTRYPMPSGALPRVLHRAKSRTALSPVYASAWWSIILFALRSATGWVPGDRGRTLHDAISRVPGEGSRRLLSVIAGVSWTTDSDALDLDTAVRMSMTQGGVVTMLGTRGGAQDALIAEGAGTIAERLADELGAAVRLGERVIEVNRSERSVIVTTATGSHEFDRVVIAVPPPVAAAIHHEPPLPLAREVLEQDTAMGSVYKAIAVYERPFWRDLSHGDAILLDEPGGSVFDTSPPDGAGHLCFLIPGQEGRALAELSEDQRQAALLPPLVKLLGPRVRRPLSWHDKSWHLDPHVRGGYTALPLSGSRIDALPLSSDPVGRVHWAGSELATGHPGYIDGAIESGERTAGEVAAALRG